MKAQASSNIKAQAPIKGGGPPTSSLLVRQIVAGTMCHIDRQIVTWAVAQGHRHRHRHRHRPVDNLKYFLSRHISNTLLWEIVGCQINNNGGDYGIKIRLHNLGHRKMDRGATRHSCKFCMADDVHRHARYNEGECGRNYFSFRISSENWFWSIYQKNSSSRIKGSSTGLDWLQNQRQAGAAFQVYPKMDENCRARAARILGSEIVSTSNPGEQSPGFFYAWIIINNKDKAQATR
jgi:hypothetical protein